jgi:hypothetical protein
MKLLYGKYALFGSLGGFKFVKLKCCEINPYIRLHIASDEYLIGSEALGFRKDLDSKLKFSINKM